MGFFVLHQKNTDTSRWKSLCCTMDKWDFRKIWFHRIAEQWLWLILNRSRIPRRRRRRQSLANPGRQIGLMGVNNRHPEIHECVCIKFLYWLIEFFWCFCGQMRSGPDYIICKSIQLNFRTHLNAYEVKVSNETELTWYMESCNFTEE